MADNVFHNPLIEKYEGHLLRDPRSKSFAPLAEIYRKMGLHEKSMQVLKNGIQMNPSYAQGYLCLSLCYFDLEQFELAYSTIRPFIESNRDNIRMLKHFAECCLKLNKNDEALDNFKFLLFLNPKDEYVQKQVELLQNEGSEKVLIEKPESISFATEKIDSNPSFDSVDNWKSVNLSEEDSEVEESTESNNSSVSLETIDPIEKINLFDQGESEVEELQVRDEPIITLTLVDLYVSQGHLEKAKEVLTKIIELNPSYMEARDRLLQLNELIEKEAASEEDDSIDEDQQAENLMNLIDVKVKKSQSVEDQKIEKLYSFLDKIKEKRKQFDLR